MHAPARRSRRRTAASRRPPAQNPVGAPRHEPPRAPPRPATTGRRARTGPDPTPRTSPRGPSRPGPRRAGPTTRAPPAPVCGSSASSAPGSGIAWVRTTSGDPLGSGCRRGGGPGEGGHRGHSTAACGGPRDSGPRRPLRHNGAVNRATLDKDPSDVARMFDGVAARYDLTNDVLSLGQDRLWRRATIAALGCEPGRPRPRHRRRHGDQLRAARRRRRGRRAGRLLARHAAGRPPPSPRHAVHGGRRDAPAVRRRAPSTPSRCRSGCATSPTPPPPSPSSAGSPGPAAAGRLRVQPPGERRVPRGLPPLPHGAPCPGSPAASRRTPTPTSTSPSRSRRGRRSATSP